ncbi:MAG: hypothetical protein OXM87_12415 [Truepera sp.]|nr:hypothetical protein [Truepera sp.]
MAIRLAAGSAEASLAYTRLWQEAGRMSREGLGFILALAPLAELSRSSDRVSEVKRLCWVALSLHCGPWIDIYLYLIDTTASLYIGADDDSPDTSRSKITFTAQRGVSYWIEATSFSGLDAGTFELSVTMVPGGLDALTSPVEVPRPPSYSIYSTSPNSCPGPSRCSATTSVITMATRPTRAAW